MIIPLGHALPQTSSDRTRKHRASNPYPTFPHNGGMVASPPYLVLLRVGFTELPMSPSGLVRSYRTVSPLPERPCVAARRSTRAPGGLFSVALSLGSPPLDVIQHPALRSPDFPPPALTARRDHLISFVLLCINPNHLGWEEVGDANQLSAGQSKMRLQWGQVTIVSCFLTSDTN